MAHKPLQWLQEFNQARGFEDIRAILLDCKAKYSTSFSQSTFMPTAPVIPSAQSLLAVSSVSNQLFQTSNINTVGNRESNLSVANLNLNNVNGLLSGGINNLNNTATTSLSAFHEAPSLSTKDSKDLRLTHEIKFECMKILRSFANTPVIIYNTSTPTHKPTLTSFFLLF